MTPAASKPAWAAASLRPVAARSPRVSVIVAAHNEESTLERTVTSVLNQSIEDVDVIVVDDGSEIPAAEVLADVTDQRLRVIRHERNAGLSRARNTGLAAARAPFISPLDADDAWYPNYLERVLPAFSDASIGLVYTNAVVNEMSGTRLYITDTGSHPIDSFPELARYCPIPNPTVTLRAEALREMGGYATWLWGAQDWHLYCKLAATGWRFSYVDEPLAVYQWYETEGSMSFHTDRMKISILKMWAGFFARYPSTWRAYRPVAEMIWRGARKKLVVQARRYRASVTR
jgi:glycosyltransferase involved in cell wall biosynthesis